MPSTDTASLIRLLLADARLPTGSHAHSAGLEPMLLAGMPPAQLLGYVRDRLRTLTTTEAAAAVIARHTWWEGTSGGLDAVTLAWQARTPSPGQREAADRLGRGYARVARRVWPEQTNPDAIGPRGARTDLRYPRPVVLGVIAAITDLPARDLALLIAYDDVQSITAAALKLLPLDPLEVTAWVLELQPEIAQVVETVTHLRDPADMPSRSLPLLDAYVADHAHASRRLFHA